MWPWIEQIKAYVFFNRFWRRCQPNMFGFLSAEKSKHRKLYFGPDFKQRKISYWAFEKFDEWAENYAYKQTRHVAEDMGFVSKGAHMQKAHTSKRPKHQLIFKFNFADTLYQIQGHCLVFFCAIDCQHIFD